MSKSITRWMSVLVALCVVHLSCFAAGQPAPVNLADYKEAIKLACVGDSITAGFGAPKQVAYPAQLGRMLGEKWAVQACGVSGATLLNKGSKPYQKLGAFGKAKEMNPDVVVIILGTNDSNPKNWSHKDDFDADYKDMIRQFSELASKPRIYICLPPPVLGKGAYGCNEANVLEEIPMIEKIAQEMKVGVIDIHGAMKEKSANEKLSPDGVHPNGAGAAVIAATIYEALTGAKPTDDVLKAAAAQTDEAKAETKAEKGKKKQ